MSFYKNISNLDKSLDELAAFDDQISSQPLSVEEKRKNLLDLIYQRGEELNDILIDVKKNIRTLELLLPKLTDEERKELWDLRIEYFSMNREISSLYTDSYSKNRTGELNRSKPSGNYISGEEYWKDAEKYTESFLKDEELKEIFQGSEVIDYLKVLFFYGDEIPYALAKLPQYTDYFKKNPKKFTQFCSILLEGYSFRTDEIVMYLDKITINELNPFFDNPDKLSKTIQDIPTSKRVAMLKYLINSNISINTKNLLSEWIDKKPVMVDYEMLQKELDLLSGIEDGKMVGNLIMIFELWGKNGRNIILDIIKSKETQNATILADEKLRPLLSKDSGIHPEYLKYYLIKTNLIPTEEIITILQTISKSDEEHPHRFNYKLFLEENAHNLASLKDLINAIKATKTDYSLYGYYKSLNNPELFTKILTTFPNFPDKYLEASLEAKSFISDDNIIKILKNNEYPKSVLSALSKIQKSDLPSIQNGIKEALKGNNHFWIFILKKSEEKGLNTGLYISILKSNLEFLPENITNQAVVNSISEFKKVSEESTAKRYFSLLEKYLTLPQKEVEQKIRILSLFKEFFETPESFQVYSQGDNITKAILSNGVLFSLLKNLSKENFDNIREEWLTEMIDFAENILSEKPVDIINTQNYKNLYTKAKFTAMSSSNIFINNNNITISENLKQRIIKLNDQSKSPDKSLFEDKTFTAIIYFQEINKEQIWKKMYIEPFGYNISGYTLKNPKKIYTTDSLKEYIKIENKNKLKYGNFSTSLMNQLIKNNKITRDNITITWEDLTNMIKRIHSEQEISLENLKTRKVADTLRRFDIIDEEIWERSWKDSETQETRFQRIHIPFSPAKSTAFDRSIFEKIDSTGDSRIDYIIYNGHAGGGTTLNNSIQNAEHSFTPQMVQLSNCWSNRDLPPVKKHFPNADVLVNERTSMTGDGALAFGTVMESIKEKWRNADYIKMEESTRDNEYGIRAMTQQGGRNQTLHKKYYEDRVGNLSFPHNTGKYSDIDGDGIPDNEDHQFNFTAEKEWGNSYVFAFNRPIIRDLIAAPTEKTSKTIGFIARYFEDEPFLKHFSDQPDFYGNRYQKYVLDTSINENQRGGYFIDPYDSENLIKTREAERAFEDTDGSISHNRYKLMALNLGYADIHIELLRAKVFMSAAKDATDNNFKLTQQIFNEEIIQKQEVIGDSSVFEELGISPLARNIIFEKLRLNNETEKVKMINKVRILFSGLGYWKRAWNDNKTSLSRDPENQELIDEKQGLTTILEEILETGDWNNLDITPEEIISLYKASDMPYLMFLRLLIKKQSD